MADKDRIYTQDSAVVEAAIYNEDENPEAVSGVAWSFLRPDGEPLIIGALPSTPVAGEAFVVGQTLTDGVTTFNPLQVVGYDGANWQQITPDAASILDNNEATLVLPGSVTYQDGVYRGRAQFTLADGTTRSSIVQFEAIDPLYVQASTGIDSAVDHAWLKIEDLFDSEFGGPWLSDKTRSMFNRDKLALLLPDALYVINNQYQPVTDFDPTNWPTEHYPLVSQALLVEAIYHLIRSYTEQPLPAGGQLSYFDRRDYMSRWQSVLQQEEQKLFRLVDVFKLAYTGFGVTSILVGGYATPITRLSKFWRTRYPRYIGPWGF